MLYIGPVVFDNHIRACGQGLIARKIEANLDLSSTPCIIDGDLVLLEQVIVNLVRNAMDAMGETPPERRQITIRSAVKAAATGVNALKAFQQRQGLPADGVAGYATLQALGIWTNAPSVAAPTNCTLGLAANPGIVPA